jgi:hypothetical protein
MALSVAALAWPALAAGPASQLEAPVQILAGGKAIDVDMGNAAPCVADFGDGTLHLLVGQFKDGKLRVYRNVGTRAAPRFDSFAWFQDDAPAGRVPAG